MFLTAATNSNPGSMVFMLIAMFAVFYFMIIRPENKRKKKTDEMRQTIKNGSKITTIGGIYGEVVQVTEDTITFETGEDRVRIQIKKWAVSTTDEMEAAEAEAKNKKKKK